MPPQQLIIHRQDWEKMQSHVISLFPEEACGLLAGISEKVNSVYPVKNILESRYRFRMDPHEQLAAFLDIEKNQWELLGMYHSHPQGDAFPSETDLAESYYPEIAYLVWALINHEWMCRAFLLDDKDVTSINIHLEN
jgi:proteasome lid subunit RPN8/RPN11